MSTPSAPFAKLQADTDQHRLGFLQCELGLCFTFSVLAARRYETGNRESADRSLANAEKASSSVIFFLSDPKHAKHMTDEEVGDITGELERLRQRLDGLQRCSEGT